MSISLVLFVAAVVCFGIAAFGGQAAFVPIGLMLFAAGHISYPPAR